MTPSGRFTLGRVVATPGALQLLEQHEHPVANLLHRHRAGDWGEVCNADAQANEEALHLGLRLLSRYQVENHAVWVITEADRSVTTLLLPEEY